MGTDKARLELEGVPVLASLVARLQPLCAGGVMVIRHAEQVLPDLPPSCRVEEDLISDCGALGGLYTALKKAETPWIFAVACDMPLLSPQLVEWMRGQPAADAQVIVPIRDGFLEPLHALYSVSCLEAVEGALASGKRRMNSWFDSVRVIRVSEELWRCVHPSGHSFLNVNRPHDLERVAEVLASR